MAERDLSGKSRQEPQPAGPHGVDADGVEQEDEPPCPPGRQQQAGDKYGKPKAIKSRVQDGHVLDITRLEVAGRPHTHRVTTGNGGTRERGNAARTICAYLSRSRVPVFPRSRLLE